jgi:D-alanine-D-alanine ligase
LKKRLNVSLLFDYHTSLPADLDFAKRLGESDWLPIKSVSETLAELGHEVKLFPIYDEILPLVEHLTKEPPDLVFNMADTFRNNRDFEASLVGLLELSGVPYTGCPSQSLSLCHSKSFAKRILVPLGIHLPQALVFPVGQTQRPLNSLRFPVIVKPLSEEGSEGISQNSFAETEEKCLERVRFLHENLGADAYVEEYIEGREIYAGVLGNSRLSLLPLREMLFQKFPEGQPKFATFKAKWDEAFREKWGIKNVFAKDLGDTIEKEIDQVSRTVYRSLGLRGCGRIDMRVTPKGEVFVLEVNPNPNLAPDDEIAEAARKAGLSYPQLIQKMLSLGLKEAEIREEA